MGRFERWPDTLAKASFQKVFPSRNIWKLRWLTLREFLDFPPNEEVHLKEVLNNWTRERQGEGGVAGLGDYLYMAGTVTETVVAGANADSANRSEYPIQLPPIMPY